MEHLEESRTLKGNQRYCWGKNTILYISQLKLEVETLLVIREEILFTCINMQKKTNAWEKYILCGPLDFDYYQTVCELMSNK